jgi:hypothetical protein
MDYAYAYGAESELAFIYWDDFKKQFNNPEFIRFMERKLTESELKFTTEIIEE